MDPAGIPALRDAIRHLHGADSRHVATEYVHDVAPTGEVAWDGDVEVFELSGSDKPLRCYAWSEATTGTKRRFFAVLGVGQIDSATRAVRASILMDSTAT
jgi:hypothetical protein